MQGYQHTKYGVENHLNYIYCIFNPIAPIPTGEIKIKKLFHFTLREKSSRLNNTMD